MSLPAKNYLCTDYKKQTKSRWAKKGKKNNKKCLKSAQLKGLSRNFKGKKTNDKDTKKLFTPQKKFVFKYFKK